jgi:CHAT domain-containing protein
MNLRRMLLMLVVMVPFLTSAQDPADKLVDQLFKGLNKAAKEKRNKLDSLDFQYAISVSDNAAIFDIQTKGEGLAKAGYMLDTTRTDAERGRDLLDQALWYYGRRWFVFADQSFQEAKTFFEAKSLTNDINYVKTLASLGLLNSTTGKLSAAETYLESVLNIVEPNSPAYVATINNRGKVNHQAGRYNQAEEDFLKAGELVVKVHGAKSLQHAIVLNNTAILYQTMGRFEQAEAMLKKAIAIAEPLQREKSREHRMMLTNLALLYQQTGKLQQAETSFQNIKKITENRGQTAQPEYADVLTQLAIVYIAMKKYDQVDPLLKKAQGVYKKRFTENHPSYAKSLSIQGNFFRMTGKLKEAEPLLDKALSIREETLGVNHPDYVQSKEDKAILYWKTGRADQAYMTYREVMDKTIEFINSYFPPMSEAEKTSYWDVTAPRFQRFFNFAMETNATIPAVAQDFFDYNMATKALLLNSTGKVKAAILKSKDAALIKDYLAWLDQKEQLARLYAYSKEELKEQKINLAEMERSVNAMEKSLSGRSADFSAGYSTQKISYKQVAGVLAEAEVLVDLVRVHTFDQQFTDQCRYVAFILKKGSAAPQMLVLDNGQQLETRYVKFYRNAIQQKMDDAYSYEQFWARIAPAVEGKKVVFVSPDGVYNQINLNTLRKPEGAFVVNQYEIVAIGNSKDLLEIKSRKATAPKKNAFLLGFPDYATTEVASLPGTKVEIDGVVKILKASGYQVSLFMQKEATEKNVKAIKSPQLVHIATHGYFLQDVDTQEGSVFGVNSENASNNPLLRSGLILAGAGKTITGTQGTDLSSNDNGVLTAYEAMNLNLNGTDLVILSACETGLGDIKAGEGVYGLQRAFLVAGAQAIIMSLWKVDDAASQMLMTNFYNNWIKTGNKQKAFRQAQVQLMAKYPEPYYWGAFVMIGM